MSKTTTVLGGWPARIFFVAILILAAWLVISVLFPKLAAPLSGKVATWKGGSASREDYDSWLRFIELLDSPAAIREMVLLTHLSAEARRLGLDREAGVKVEIDSFRHRALAAALRNHLIGTVSVSSEEIEKLGRENPAAFQKPRKLQMRNIYLPLGSSSEQAAATRRRIEEIRADLLAGGDFKAIASRESQSQTRFNGGRLPLLDPSTLPEAVEAAVSDLAEGEISEVVEDAGGVSVYLCESILEAVNPTPEEKERKIRNNLTRLRQKKLWEEYTARVFEEVEVTKPKAEQEGVAECNGNFLSAAELEALIVSISREKGRDPAQIMPQQVNRILRNWCMGANMERRALELGLDREQEAADNLRWGVAQILAEHAMAAMVKMRLKPSAPDEVKRYFEANQKHYQHQPEYRIAAIFFGPADEEGEDLINRAESVYRQIENGTLTFAEAAASNSRHASSDNGGDLGWLSAIALAQWGPAFARAVRQLKPGESTGVFRLKSGIWIFELRDYRASRPMTFEEAEPIAAKDAANAQGRSLEKAVREELLQALSLKILPEDVNE